MRASTILFGFAAGATAMAGSMSGMSMPTVVPIQQIGDGQIQNPVSPPAAPPAAPSSAYNAPPPSSKPAPPPAPPSSAYNAPPAPSGGGIPPSYGNVTATHSKTKTNTATVVKPTGPASAPATSAPSAPSATTSKPAVQTANSANTLVGSTIGLGFFAVLAAFLG